MRLFITLASFLLAGVLAGCTTEVDMANMRDNTLHSTQIQADQVTTIEEQLARFGAAEAERQRSLLRLNAALDALRVQQRTLRGELEELQYLQEQASSGLEYRLAALDQRLRGLETQPGTSGMAQGFDAVSDDLLLPQIDANIEPQPVVVPRPQSPVRQDAAALPPANPVREPPSAQEPLDVAAVPPANLEPEPLPDPPSTPEPREVAVAPAEPEAEPVAEPPRDDPQAARLFQRARDDYQQGNYEVAIILFKQYLRQYPRSAQAGDAQYWIGESLYAQKEFNAAIVAFDEVIQEHPRNDRVASSTLKVGLSFANLGDQPNARFFLQQVQENFPNSAEAQLATEKLKQLRR
jgi:tol-pal system protein YbgF